MLGRSVATAATGGAAARYGQQGGDGYGEEQVTGKGGKDAGAHSDAEGAHGELGEAQMAANRGRWPSMAGG